MESDGDITADQINGSSMPIRNMEHCIFKIMYPSMHVGTINGEDFDDIIKETSETLHIGKLVTASVTVSRIASLDVSSWNSLGGEE